MRLYDYRMDNDKYKNKYRIKSSRLPHWNYANDGFYFVTICTYGREYFFGEIIKDEMKMSSVGDVVKREFLKTVEMRKNIKLDRWVIMPNHSHMIIAIDNGLDYGDSQMRSEYKNKFGPQKNSLSSIIRGFKSSVTKICNELNLNDFKWQERFYDRIVRNSDELDRIRQYIINNPLKWDLDWNNPENLYI
jgi:putative transposase